MKTCVDTLEEGCSSASSAEFRKAYEAYQYLRDDQKLAGMCVLVSMICKLKID